MTDRQIDRRFGIWSNSVDVHAPVGITSTDDATYFVWQDTRNGRELGQAEDVYFSAMYHDGAAASDAAGLPAWAWGGSGLAIGMGLAMLIAVGLRRRRQPQPAR